MITGSKELIRDINSTLVLETIINQGPISRANISKVLGLTKATISAIVADLINRNLVEEIGCDNTEFGRKPILLSFQRKAGYMVSIDLGVDTMSVMLTDLQGENCRLKQMKTPQTKNGILETLIHVIDSVKPDNDTTPYGLVGIALGIHGVVHDNKVSFAPYYNLQNYDLAGKLNDYFHTPVYLENEANLSVLGEKTFMHNYPNIANISVHSGIGLGILINNELYTGYNGRAGEFGHTIIEIDGRECPCGNHGCLEQYVSERALLKDFADKKGLDSITFDAFLTFYKEGDADAIAMINLFVKLISICTNNILNAYNPEIVIINSSFTSFIPGLSKRIEACLCSRMNSFISIESSSLRDSSILLGGICVIIKNFLGIKDLNLSNKKESGLPDSGADALSRSDNFLGASCASRP
ncbi:ROK family transcriptional regulator [Anaerocolumna xylanovorans]|uniref:Sugar kinase of the NBD/HSP70 family, may contain an N-terminal HTH domain n=1 Tax=Anaerocolumna xylanovorans DSM 12503 TaxID=1121345 RepID=A0A1M7YHC1_9FIRM|nr:ROK family transcriptional regulator [Anaerocolumna xylanovorans]SHO52003.1 Sugar kinase of the NBD/HSP70 family, may contain an N-terminal HTH domain [Anaerocolumna xylanovorans DSM 12503]